MTTSLWAALRTRHPETSEVPRIFGTRVVAYKNTATWMVNIFAGSPLLLSLLSVHTARWRPRQQDQSSKLVEPFRPLGKCPATVRLRVINDHPKSELRESGLDHLEFYRIDGRSQFRAAPA
jgi:hypothetical protein